MFKLTEIKKEYPSPYYQITYHFSLLIKDLEIFELKNTNKRNIRGWGYIRILCQNIIDYIS